MEFARAEQQPGEHAAKIADLEAQIAFKDSLIWHSRESAVYQDAVNAEKAQRKAEADLTRLRARLAALEQEMWAEVSQGAQSTVGSWVGRLAALREGR